MPNQTAPTDRAETTKVKWIGAGIAADIVVVQVQFGLSLFIATDTWETRGEFKDMFGSINALYSGLALAGVVTAIFLQNRELQLQRDELQLQRQELE